MRTDSEAEINNLTGFGAVAKGRDFEHIPRVLGRHVAALSRGEFLSVTCSSANTRMFELQLSEKERKADRYARSQLGRAIREARVRAALNPVRLSPPSPAVVDVRHLRAG